VAGILVIVIATAIEKCPHSMNILITNLNEY
jgi:hypothetical protein